VAKLIKDENTGQEYILAVSRNIEERKMHEQQLELVTNNISDEITMFDLTGRYSYASPSAVHNRGYKDFEEMQKTNALDLYSSKEEVNAILNKLKKEGIINWEGKFKQCNGIFKWYEATAKLIKDNITGKEYIVAISRNISDRKKHEKQLELITTNTSDEITMYNLNGEYLFASPSAIKNRGYKDFEELKKTNVFSKFKQGVVEKLLEEMRHNEFVNFEGLFKVNHDEFKWYEATSKLVTDENDNQYIISVSRNIEQRKKYEEYMELNLKKEQELNQLKSNFISTSSHEFKTPMAIIKNAVEILMSSELVKTKNGLNPFFEKYLSRIDNEVDRVVSLMNDTLLLEKAHNNSLMLHKKETDITFLLLQIAEKYNSLNNNRKVMINSHKRTQKAIIDPDLMEHVFDNLISNAFKYSEGKKSPEVIINYTDKTAEIIIIDYGMGIPPDALQKLSTPFFRANNTSGVQGTGMGLSIVKKILDLHSADLSLESVLNEGTKVTVTIPYHSN